MSDTNPEKLQDAARKLKDQGDLEGCVTALQHILTIDPGHVQHILHWEATFRNQDVWRKRSRTRRKWQS